MKKCGLSLTSVIDQKTATFKKPEDFERQAALLVRMITSARLADIAESALDAMFKSDHANTFFNSWFSAGRSDSLQIVPCEKVHAGKINIALCGLQMSTRTKPIPWYQWFSLLSSIPGSPLDYEMTLLLKGGNFVYDGAQYAQHRERVQQELLARGVENIERIEL